MKNYKIKKITVIIIINNTVGVLMLKLMKIVYCCLYSISIACAHVICIKFSIQPIKQVYWYIIDMIDSSLLSGWKNNYDSYFFSYSWFDIRMARLMKILVDYGVKKNFKLSLTLIDYGKNY
jgi:hypothetical protein